MQMSTEKVLVSLDLSAYDVPKVVEALKTAADDFEIGVAPGQAFWGRSIYRDIARQIEAQTRPPKPAEPTGLGAVVEDTDGERYVRTSDDYAPWLGGNYVPSVGLRKTWREVPAVRVLSEGVSDE